MLVSIGKLNVGAWSSLGALYYTHYATSGACALLLLQHFPRAGLEILRDIEGEEAKISINLQISLTLQCVH